MILGIIRGATKDNIISVIDTAVSGGINEIEVPLNSPDALEQIKLAAKKHRVGAGTVLSAKDAESAIKAGAAFIVSPIANEGTIKYCLKTKVPIYPGALTPSEVYRAFELGATMVKIFPVKSVGGPEYIKELKGPFNNIKLLACGGVNTQNIREYFKAGVEAVAVGGSIFSKELMDAGNYPEIEKRVRQLVNSRSSV